MNSTSTLTNVLHTLAREAQGKDSKPDLRAAVPVVADVSRMTVLSPLEEVREMQAAVATLWERLRYSDSPLQKPSDALKSETSHIFLAGALWALVEGMNSRIESQKAQDLERAGTPRRQQIRQLVLSALSERTTITPRVVLDNHSQLDPPPRGDEVSRALGDLMKEQMVQGVVPPPESDRRNKFYELSAAGRAALVDRPTT